MEIPLMATFVKEQTRWLYIVEARSYAIGFYKGDSWHCYLPLCYASHQAIAMIKAVSEIDDETMYVTLIIQTDKLDYRKVIIGNLVTCEIQEPRAWQMSREHVEEPKPGKIIINGQVVYGWTPFGTLWTPVRPDMGAVDMYERDWGKIHTAIGKNLGITEATWAEE
jgi:hypothetical protein